MVAVKGRKISKVVKDLKQFVSGTNHVLRDKVSGLNSIVTVMICFVVGHQT